MYRKLTEDIDVSTLQDMRNRGMDNIQIAEHIGCSYKTVLKYLGKQPKEMRKVRERHTPSVVDYKDVKPPVLRVVNSVSTLEGSLNKYIVDTSNRSIEISGLVEGILDKDSLPKFIEELQEIKMIFQNIGGGESEDDG